ncbi:MAG: cupredoxin domain-containing protein [Proteobacteria bacterium]|nr:cupredoxin domain-containing protein [Pseudomonadota bacterium]MBS0573883.1 cupredoxin domain-containing protein [Pseudomonadota bacterium]
MSAAPTRRGVLGAALALPLAWIGARAARAAAGTLHEVEISGMAFVPPEIAAAPGDRVRWTNRDLVPHTATATDQSWTSPPLKKGDSYTLEVTKGMTGTYKCRFHPSMTGTIKLSG